MKQKILYIITQGHWGGAQKYVSDLALNFSKEYEVAVACGEHESELFDSLKNSAVQTIHIPHLIRAINPIEDINAFLYIAKTLKNKNFDIAHANSSKAGFLTALAHAWVKITNGSTYRTKLIYTAHGWIFMEPIGLLKKSILLFMERVAAKLRTATVVLSQKEKNIAIQYGVAKNNSLNVVPNGIDCARINFFDRQTAREHIQKLIKLNNTNDRPWVGTIANLYKTKGIETFIQSASRFRNNTKLSPYFFVIGNGPERAKLEMLIKQLNLSDSFFLLGTIKNASELLKAFDVFVLPSLKEGFPFALLEAACASIPIIATKVGAIPEIIEDKKNGFIFPCKDSIKLADAISRILENPALYETIKNNTQKITSEFSLAKMIEQTHAVYSNLLNN